MSEYMSLTAAQLAGCLMAVDQVPGNTGALSAIDEATMAYGRLSGALYEAQRAFSRARMACWPPSEAAWDLAVSTASSPPAELLPLGDYVLPRCGERTGYGTCNSVLADGRCPFPGEHLEG